MQVNRRSFLRTSAAGFGSILLMPSCLKQQSLWRFFTEAEAACVIAMCEQIIPEDQWGGGATEAGVIHYIDRQLVAVFTYDQALYQQGIAALQEVCLDAYGKRFEKLDQDIQLEVMEKLEQGALGLDQWNGPVQGDFFNLVLGHTRQGFYGPPRHGGNKNYMSYKMMGLDYPLLIGRNHYEHLND